MIINIIGYGSIAKRHVNVLCLLGYIFQINIFIRNKKDYAIKDPRITFKLIKDLEYTRSDLTIIASPANSHFEYIKKTYKNSRYILVEKPLVDYSDAIKTFNDIDSKIYVAYNLRQMDLIRELRSTLVKIREKKLPFSLNIYNSSHVSLWRSESIKNSISLDPERGGGALLELSHDLDLVNFLIGINCKDTMIVKSKIPLGIEKIDNCYLAYGKSKCNSPYYIYSTFSSHIKQRIVQIDLNDKSYRADLIDNTLKEFQNEKEVNNIQYQDERNDTFLRQIVTILSANTKDYDKSSLCSFEEGLHVQSLIWNSKWM